jgi:uroporphyrinogen decarboxylase
MKDQEGPGTAAPQGERMIEPDFERFRTMLLRDREPDRVPLGDVSIHRMLQERFLGRPIRSLEDEVEFWYRAGYDHFPIHIGLQETSLIKQQTMHELEANYAADTMETQRRSWATEGKGLIGALEDLNSVQWPDPDALDYSVFDRVDAILPPRVKIIAVMGKIFTSVSWLMGLEGLSLATMDNPDLIKRLFDKVGEFQLRVLENVLQFDRVGVIWHADDIAFSTQLMVNPRLLRENLFHRYSEMNRLTHERGKLAVYHSDGSLDQVMEDVLGCGFDGLNPIEPKAMDINELKREYGARISLIGNIDLGYTLTLGTPEEVWEEVRQRIRDLAPGGGYAVASSNSVPEYVPFANFMAMREATFEYGRYPIGF